VDLPLTVPKVVPTRMPFYDQNDGGVEFLAGR
jgi:hypothetical protein